LVRYFKRPYRKSSISALVVGKPFFLLLLSDFLTLGLKEREYYLKQVVILLEVAISFKTSRMRAFKRREETASPFSFLSPSTASSSESEEISPSTT
jgi:hypothetical protein